MEVRKVPPRSSRRRGRTPETAPKNPNATIIIREHRGQPFYEAKFRHQGRQVKRRIGPAWFEQDTDTGHWSRHQGRLPDDAYDERRAHVADARLVADYVSEATNGERVEQERRMRGVTFHEVARAYLRWLEDVRGAKPSTLREHACVLGEPGVPYKYGSGTTVGHVMAALGDRPAARITTREIDELLAMISATGASPRTVNKYRRVIAAAFNHGTKPSTFGLPANPVEHADKRQERHPDALVFYAPDQVEALVRALANGRHRDRRCVVASGAPSAPPRFGRCASMICVTRLARC